MTDSTTIARPYAKAAFSLAKADQNFSEWRQILSGFSEIFQEEGLLTSICSPGVDPLALVRLFNELVTTPLSAVQERFFLELINNKRLSILPQISLLFDSYCDEESSVVRVVISTPFPINDQQLSEIVRLLSIKVGSEVQSTVLLDPDLIGGFSVKIENEVIDLSIRGKLNQLACALTY